MALRSCVNFSLLVLLGYTSVPALAVNEFAPDVPVEIAAFAIDETVFERESARRRALRDIPLPVSKPYKWILSWERTKYHARVAKEERERLVINRAIADASVLTSHAIVLMRQGNYVDATIFHRRALVIVRKALGENHAVTARSYNNLAFSLDSGGLLIEAEPYYKYALDIRSYVLGDDDLDTVLSYNNLGLNLNSQGRYSEAQPLLMQAMELRGHLLEDDHPDMAKGFREIALNLEAQGKYPEAELFYRKSIAIHQRMQGADHPLAARSCFSLALNLIKQKKLAEAKPLLARAVKIGIDKLGEDDDVTLAYLADYNKHYETWGSWPGNRVTRWFSSLWKG